MQEKGIQELNQTQALAQIGPTILQDQRLLDVSSEEVPHLLDYWHIVVKRRWVVLSALLIVFTTVTIGTLKQRPVYEGKVLIEINPEQPQVLNFREVAQVAPTVDIDSYRETQYAILLSRTLAESVSNDLKLYQYPEFYKKRVLFGLFEFNPDKIPSPSDSAPPDSKSEAYRNTLDHFRVSTDVNPIRRSNLVEVSFFSTDPQLAAEVANKLADSYIQQNLQIKWDETSKASEWLEVKMTEQKAKLEKAEDNLQSYARANSIVFITQSQNLVNASLEQVQTEYTKAQAERFVKESQYSLLQQGKIQDLPGILDNKLIQDLEMKLADLDREYGQTTAWVKPDYPRARAILKEKAVLEKKVDEKKKALLNNIADEYHSAVAREKYLAQAVEDRKKDVNAIAEKTIQYNILKREADSDRQLYDGLLERLKEAKVSSGLSASNIHVVDSADVPKSQSKPRVLLNLFLGVILGLGLGVGLAFFQEYMDNTLKTSDEVETLLRLPSLGVLPTLTLNGSEEASGGKIVAVAPLNGGAVAHGIQTSPVVVEAFRSLRTSILLSANPVPKMILITSALPSEGKTTVAVNLGATLASLGSNVIIIDCDMRRPSLHHSTGVENNPGFVQALTGHVDLQQAILPVPGVTNLSAIPCGPIPPNPAEVLSSPLTGELLRRLRSQFEYVIVDSPPLLSVADSRILATITDGVVMVVRAYGTPYDVVRRARALLYGAGARILGVALNDVDIRGDGYGYSYDYRYDYGAPAAEQPQHPGKV